MRQSTQSTTGTLQWDSEATRHGLSNVIVTSHGQIRVSVDAEVTNHCRWHQAEGTDDGTAGGQTTLAMDRCAPHELRLVAVELQAVGLHPSGDGVDASGNCR